MLNDLVFGPIEFDHSTIDEQVCARANEPLHTAHAARSAVWSHAAAVNVRSDRSTVLRGIGCLPGFSAMGAMGTHSIGPSQVGWDAYIPSCLRGR